MEVFKYLISGFLHRGTQELVELFGDWAKLPDWAKFLLRGAAGAGQIVLAEKTRLRYSEWREPVGYSGGNIVADVIVDAIMEYILKKTSPPTAVAPATITRVVVIPEKKAEQRW